MAQSKSTESGQILSGPGSMGCRQRVGLGDMPEEILLLIFSFLRAPFLRPLRLVCRSFRQVTVEQMTGLRLADGNRGSLSNALRVFPKISALTIQARFPASSEAWPESVSQLKSLVIHRSAMDKALGLSGLLHCLSGLTFLTFLTTMPCPWVELCGMHDIVAWCPALRTLELEQGFLFWDPVKITVSIMQLRALQELKLFCAPHVWSSLLPRLTSLTLLQSLSGVCVQAEQDVTALAALTHLTSLGAMLCFSQWVDCCQALTGLARISLSVPCGEESGPLGPLLQRLPTSLEGLCVQYNHGGASADDLRLISRMTGLDRLDMEFGFWSLGASDPWCASLVGLRRLGLVGEPSGAPTLRLLAQHLTALEHLRLRLKLFDDVQHLAGLTRLTLLHLYKGTSGVASPRALGPPRFVTALQRLRHLSLYWEIRPGEERETVRCLAALVELERLHVTLEPLERGQGSHPRGRQHAVKRLRGSKARQRAGKVSFQVLHPLVRQGLCKNYMWMGGFVVDMETWDRIRKLRVRLGLPLLTSGSALTEDGDIYANAVA